MKAAETLERRGFFGLGYPRCLRAALRIVAVAILSARTVAIGKYRSRRQQQVHHRRRKAEATQLTRAKEVSDQPLGRRLGHASRPRPADEVRADERRRDGLVDEILAHDVVESRIRHGTTEAGVDPIDIALIPRLAA